MDRRTRLLVADASIQPIDDHCTNVLLSRRDDPMSSCTVRQKPMYTTRDELIDDGDTYVFPMWVS